MARRKLRADDMEVEHKGYALRYSQNEDTWRCWDLDIEDTRLGSLKAKIDKLLADARRVPLVPVLIEGGWHERSDFEEAQITLIADDAGKEVWVRTTKKVRGSFGRGVSLETVRTKRDMESCILDTPENRAAFAELARLERAAKAASKAAEDYRRTMDYLTPEKLKAHLNGK